MMWDDFEWESRSSGSFYFGPNPDDLCLVVFRMEGGVAQTMIDGQWRSVYWVTNVVSQNMASRPAV